jgi:hypothetical protein
MEEKKEGVIEEKKREREREREREKLFNEQLLSSNIPSKITLSLQVPHSLLCYKYSPNYLASGRLILQARTEGDTGR